MPDQPVTAGQTRYLLSIAATREIVPGLLTTRTERLLAMRRRLADGLTCVEAAGLIERLKYLPLAPRWIERTEHFAWLHAEQVYKLART